ncbi:aspartate/glutamate/uridylate kinase protein (plasmid) [Rhizobium etli]|uniref:aspartate kinase n=1 Tax=Rhizobium etli TaxID=29449 RepID=A0AAN1BLT5_RHIET|nr:MULTISPECIES: uridylate kinase [Rhizobium]ARO32518.1 aspartate/glutamate/uridylate kinase protein [Rhizobium sp. NXC14]ARQ13418.1 aspartate/glutamate/uridylate kinase protein [Rhizobium etli]
MNVAVLKFGGSSFQRPEDYGRVARHLAERLAHGQIKIVAVVSAMSGTTDKLRSVMLDVNDQARPSNLDAALATGEMLSACLLEAAVSRLGLAVMSCNGYSLGIRTDSDFGRASVESADPGHLIAALQDNDVVVAAGGQGVDDSGRITFLGRNSSDLTAIVIASMLGEHVCEIYSDVPGIYTADPNLVAGARLIPEIAYGTAAKMSRHGAKVLHHRAVDYAEQHSVTIACKSLMNDGTVMAGTFVTDQGDASTVTLARDSALLSCRSLEERNRLRDFLDQREIHAVCTDETGLCILCDVDFALRLLTVVGDQSLYVGSRSAVTELGCASLRVHLEENSEGAIARARQIHERMYPDSNTKPLCPSVPMHCSTYSSLLIHTNNAPEDRR